MTTKEGSLGGSVSRICLRIVVIITISVAAFSTILMEDAKLDLNDAFLRKRSDADRHPGTMSLKSSLPRDEEDDIKSSDPGDSKTKPISVSSLLDDNVTSDNDDKIKPNLVSSLLDDNVTSDNDDKTKPNLVSSLLDDNVTSDNDDKTKPNLVSSLLDDNDTSETDDNHDNNAHSNTTVQAKPNLVFHIGPPKTGTTTLQFGLYRYLLDTLKMDNYFYAGKYYKEGGGQPPQTDLFKYALDELFGKKSNCRLEPTCNCVDGFKEKLEPYLKSGQHVLLSAEGFIRHFSTRKHYQCLQERLGQDWNIVVAITYRRWFEWIPSKIYQGYMSHKKWSREWPVVGKHGKEVELLFPQQYKMKEDVYTTHGLELIDGQVQVKILNMYNATNAADSLTTRFVCEVLPSAEHACAKGRALDKTREGMVSRNQRGGVSPMHIFYDIVATRAVVKGMLDPSNITFTRHQARQKLRNETEVILNQTAWDFPLDCPSQDALEEYLELSLQKERTVLGEEQASQLEASHRESFWTKANSTAWCNVDADAVLEMEHWKAFFAKLQEP